MNKIIIKEGLYLKPDGRVMIIEKDNIFSNSYNLYESADQFQRYNDFGEWNSNEKSPTPVVKLKKYLETCKYLGKHE